MKLMSFLAAILIIRSCSDHSNQLGNCLHSEKGIILSCVRCGCMEELLGEYIGRYGFSLIPVYTDTNCLAGQNILKRSIQLSQSKLDSIYRDNYNIILFRKNSERIQFRV